jgi:hypothetical protein
MKKDLIVMFLLGLSTLLFLYIPQFPARCREYVGEIYELEYYYHHPTHFLSFFSFPFSIFHSFFIFHFTQDLLKGIQWCNQNLIWFFDFLSYNIF